MFQTKQAPPPPASPVSELRRPRGAPTKPLAYKHFLMFQRPVTVSRSCARHVSALLDSAWCLPDLSSPPGLSWPGWARRSRDRGCLGPTILGCLLVDVALLPGSFQSQLPPTGGSKQEKLVLWQCGEVQGQGVPREGPSCPSQPLGFACSPGGSWLWPCLPFLPPGSPGSCSFFSCEDPCPWT